MYAFTFTAENAQLFFELCHELNADTEEKRLAIIEAMTMFGKVQNIVKTPKTKEEYIKHLANKFGKVLEIKGDQENA